ncbi:MAG: tyrosine-type recombinase/integrase [Bacteroidetes bacterium]|nr:tyrosine-type recombinase/integrase [Bacteroidota bacterium]
MENLNQYLSRKCFTEKTIKEIQRTIKNYTNWLETKLLTIQDANYQDILNYIGHLQSLKYKKISINIILKHLEHYYKYKDLDNPALGLRLIGITQNKPNLFSIEDLDKIYDIYKSKEIGTYKETDKLILGLIIYQALDIQSILNLKTTDINLKKGEIIANPKTRRGQSRIIKLEPHQILPLNYYIENIHKSYKNNLFTDKERTLINQLQYITKRLKNQLKENEINLKSLNQLRQSRYAIWYKQHGIRKAQYLGGFKSAYTIQKYANLDIEDLKSAIEKFHPLG